MFPRCETLESSYFRFPVYFRLGSGSCNHGILERSGSGPYWWLGSGQKGSGAKWERECPWVGRGNVEGGTRIEILK